jgi:polyhydroxyalkanoate synthesis regulator phasin
VQEIGGGQVRREQDEIDGQSLRRSGPNRSHQLAWRSAPGRPVGGRPHQDKTPVRQPLGGREMSQQTTGTRSTGSPADTPTAAVARDEAVEVGRSAANAGEQVTATVSEQVKQVAQEATEQGRNLVGEAKSQLQGQARGGQRKAARSLRSIADELGSMAQSGDQSGPAAEVVRQAAGTMRGLADWVGQREPGDLLDELRRFARQRPGVYLLGAAAAGVLAGRLTRGASASASGARSGDQHVPPAFGEADLSVPPVPEVAGPAASTAPGGPGRPGQSYPGQDTLGGPR